MVRVLWRIQNENKKVRVQSFSMSTRDKWPRKMTPSIQVPIHFSLYPLL